MDVNLSARAVVWASLMVVLLTFAAVGVRGHVSDVDVTLDFSNLAPLARDHYEGWLIVAGGPVSTGKFVVAASGQLEDLEGNPISSFRVHDVDLDFATMFVLTIEPVGDNDTTPAPVKPLAGPLNETKTIAALTPNLGVSLAGIGGEYILATPSNDPAGNENSGVWFLNRSMAPPPVAGLTLPNLAGTDWVYEGWAVIGGIPVTTGKFDIPVGPDTSAPYHDPAGTPPFPGEDFLTNPPSNVTFPTDLSGQKIVISIEPRGAADTDPGPFQFKPLAGDVPDPALDHVEYDLIDQSSTLPSGTATLAQVPAPPPAGVPFELVVAGVAIAAVIGAAGIVLVVFLRRRTG